MDSLYTTPFSVWSNSWFSPTTLIAIAAFLFTLYKYIQLKNINKPQFTYFSFINDEHFVVIIASSYSGSIPHPKFYICKLLLGFIPTKKIFLNSILKDNKDEIERLDSSVLRTTFKDEQLFWLIPPQYLKFSKANYKVYAKTKVGVCSTIYRRTYDNLLDYLKV